MDVPGEVLEELEKIWGALGADLRVLPVRFVLQPGTLRAYLDKDLLIVPESYAKHFGRFGTIPTSLVRDMAYEAKKRELQSKGKKGSGLEADAHAYAELFLRAVMEQGPD